MKLCSACLLGVDCKFDGKNNAHPKILASSETWIPVCPEQLGGLPTPREPAEATGDGNYIIEGKAKVITRSGKDVTSCFVKGAQETLKLARLYGVKEAVLKQRSPSCGSGQIYDGTFSHKTISGDGVTTALLKKNGIAVVDEEHF